MKANEPDNARQEPYPVIHQQECKACGRCVAACREQLLALSAGFNERGYHFVQYVGSGCKGCGNCYYTCPEPGTLEIHFPGTRENQTGNAKD